MTWTLQRLTAQHASEYRALMLHAYALHPESFTSTAEERAPLPLTWWEGRLADSESPKEVVLGAIQDGVIVGVVGLTFSTRQRARHKALLFGMYVPVEHRGKGIGGALVAAALQFAARREGVCVVQLTVSEHNAGALALYEGCGFETFGVEPYAVALGAGFIAKVHMWHLLAANPITGA